MSEINKDTISQFYSTNEGMRYAINLHLKQLHNWVLFSNAFRDFGSGDILQKTVRTYSKSNNEVISEKIMLQDKSNFLVLGGPGAGKTTLVKRLIKTILNNGEKTGYHIPILVRPRDIKNGSLWGELKRILGLDFLDDRKIAVWEKMVDIINDNKFIVFIDGLDELPPSETNLFMSDLQKLYANVKKGKIISTSRSGEFHYPLNCKVVELLPFNTKQINDVLRSYTGNHPSTGLLMSKYSSFFSNPLMLNVLIYIYESYGNLPDKPIAVYRRFIDLYLDEWDSQRQVKRQSKHLPGDRKLEILSFMAYDLLVNGEKYIYTIQDVRKTFEQVVISFHLHEDGLEVFLAEIEASTGIIRREDNGLYSFLHLSLQEFLAANYLIKSVGYSVNELMQKSPSTLALAAVMSSNPEKYLEFVFRDLHYNTQTGNKLGIFISRLIQEAGEFERTRLIEVIKNLISPIEIDEKSNAVIKKLLKSAAV